MKNKMKSFIKYNKLYTILIVLILFSILFLTFRKNYYYDAFSSLTINNDNKISEYITLEDNTIKYTYFSEANSENNDENIFEKNNVISARVPNMPFGVYTVNVDYLTDYDTTEDNKPVVFLSLAEGKEETYEFALLPLVNYKSVQKGLLFVTNPLGTNWKYEEPQKQMANLNINISGPGSCIINSIEIKEYTPWKFGVILFELFILFLVFIIKYFCKTGFKHTDNNSYDNNKNSTEAGKRALIAYGIIVLILFSSFPAFTGVMKSFCIEKHDYVFHTNRIASIAAELENGNFPVIYQSDVLFGTGYISNIMYGKLLFYIPAILHLLGMPLATAHNAYTVVINALTVFIALYSFNGIFKDKKLAALGSVIYTLSSYRICAIYLRAAVGEYTAMTFFPLLIYGIYKIYFENNSKTDVTDTNSSKSQIIVKEITMCLPLLFAASGIIQSHVLTIVMLIPFISLFALVHIKTTLKKLPTLICLCIAIVCTNANFIVPFLDEYTKPLMVNERGFTDNLTKFGTKFYQVFSLFMTGGGITEKGTTQGAMPLTIGGALVAGMLLFIAVLVLSKNEKFEGLSGALECFIYGMICILLSSVYFPWIVFAFESDKISSILTSINLPWRYLEFATVLLTVCTVYAVKQLSNKELQNKYIKKTINLSIIIASFAIIVIGAFFTDFMNENPLIKVVDAKAGYVQDTWYLPKGTDTFNLHDNKPSTSGNKDVIFIGNNRHGKRVFEIVNTDSLNMNDKSVIGSESASNINRDIILQSRLYSTKKAEKFDESRAGVEITLPVIYYNFISVKDNKTGKTIDCFAGRNNCVAFDVDDTFEGQITLEYGLRPVWKIGYILSVISLLLIITFLLFFVIFKDNKFANKIIKN